MSRFTDNQKHDSVNTRRFGQGVLRSIVMLIAGLMICIAAFTAVTFAWYHLGYEGTETIKSARYGLRFTLDGQSDDCYMGGADYQKTYSIADSQTSHTLQIDLLSGTDIADVGFCIITVADQDEGGNDRTRVFYTDGLGTGGASSYAVTFDVQNAGEITIEPHWGQRASYSNLPAATGVVADQGTIQVGVLLQSGNTFTTKFPNTDQYLYRVGNGNTVKLGSLFTLLETGENAVNSSDVKIKVESVESAASVTGSGSNLEAGSTAQCVYAPNSTNWENATLKFTGEGPVKVTIKEGATGEPYTLNLEVVEAMNATTAMSATANNVVLVNNVSGGLSISNGFVLYGNGFEVRDTRTAGSGGTKGASSSYVTITGGIADNVFFRGDEPQSQQLFVGSGDSVNADTGPAILFTGEGSQLYNCRVSGGRYAVYIVNAKEALLKNTTLDGGAVACIFVKGSIVTLENCTTSVSTLGGMRGIGIHVPSVESGHITIKGSFKQYNWLKKTDLPSTYQSVFSSLFTNSDLKYSYNGDDYINCGIFFMSEQSTGDIPEESARGFVTDSNEGFVYNHGGSLGYGGTLRSAKASTATAEQLSGATFTADQYLTTPKTVFDFTVKNYIAFTEGADDYCYYDSTSKKVIVSYRKSNADDTFTWDPMILAATKYGIELDYAVSMNGTDYTDRAITFSTSGDYAVSYAYSDPYNYDDQLESSAQDYVKTIELTVTILEPEAVAYHPEFTYAGSWSSYSAKTAVIGTDVYVMPDVSATSSTIGTTTVNGTTVYYPIISLSGKNSSGGNYSSGKIYFFAPAFSAINIKDLNVDTGETLYTYNSSSQKWPHNINANNGPNSSAYYGPASTRDPYGAGTGAAYEKYAYNSTNGGLCFTSNEIERDVTANTRTVKFHYIGNDGITYYYYIQYKYNAVTHSSGGCFASGTLITLADGTQKPIEQVVASDCILAWDFRTGEYSGAEIALLVDHGSEEYEIANLTFSNGSKLRTIADHGLFDYDLNRFVYILPSNCTEYLGHRFVQYQNGGAYSIVTLEDAFVSKETTHAYSITSAGTMNAFASGILTVAPPEEFYNWMPMGEKLEFDLSQFYSDVENYGLYTYDDFEDYVTREQFDAWGGAYLKIPVEKGYFTFEFIIDLIKTYQQWML